MTNRQNPEPSLDQAFPEDGEARADAIDERIERLRRLHGWASDTRVVTAQEVAAVVEAVDGETPKASKTRLFLTYSHGGGGPREVEITDEHYDIGSGEKAKLRVFDPSLSARHCRIYRDGDGFRVRDMNTQTGTWVNGTRVPLSAPIADGDEFRCGDVPFQVRMSFPGNDSARPPAPVTVSVAPAAEQPVVHKAPEPEMTRSLTQFKAPPEDAAAPAVPVEAVAAPAGRAAMIGRPKACFVVYFDDKGDECEIEVPHDRPLVVGRKSSADLRMQDHGISSVHAAFEWSNGEVTVRDLGSTNGTWFHGERVPRAVLSDQDVVRLGLVPLRVCFVGQATTAPAPKPGPRPVVATPPIDLAHATWHLLYVSDKGPVALMSLSEREPCIVAGEGPAEIQVVGRGLKSEHLQFDWTAQGLEVMQARGDADLYINGTFAKSGSLNNGDIVTGGGLVVRIVRGGSGPGTPGESLDAQHWARRFRANDPELEFLFIDPEAAGGRVELSIWGDGMAQVDVHTGSSHERFGASLENGMLRSLLNVFRLAGFPETPRGVSVNDVAGPELCAVKGEERASVVMTDELVAASDTWREVRDMLRAFIVLVIG